MKTVPDWDKLSADELLALIDKERLPRHVAVIMDGNRRWAKQKHMPAMFGHNEGVKAFRRIVEACHDLGVQHLTAYAFSAENWHRSSLEVNGLMRLFEFYVQNERESMMKNGIRFQSLGRVDLLPEGVRREFRKTEEITAANSDMTLHLAVNYGGRAEIAEAARALALRVQKRELNPDDIDEDVVAQSLWTADCPDPDLLIRTSGELRISNFLLWQMAYTEFWFTDVLWPELTEYHFYRAVLEYQHRERRKGT